MQSLDRGTRLVEFQDLRNFAKHLKQLFSNDTQATTRRRGRPKKTFFTQPKVSPPASMVTRSQTSIHLLND